MYLLVKINALFFVLYSYLFSLVSYLVDLRINIKIKMWASPLQNVKGIGGIYIGAHRSFPNSNKKDGESVIELEKVNTRKKKNKKEENKKSSTHLSNKQDKEKIPPKESRKRKTKNEESVQIKKLICTDKKDIFDFDN